MNPLDTYSTGQLLDFSALIATLVRVDMVRIDIHGVKISVEAEFRAWEEKQTDPRFVRGINTLKEIGRIVWARSNMKKA